MTPVERYINFLNSDRFEEIISYDKHEMENDHEFIQWLFPTTTPSDFNPNAPVINIQELRQHRDFKIAQEKMLLSFKLITCHWGIDGTEVVDTKKFTRLNGHNGLRLSRVLQSLIYHGLNEQFIDLYNTVINNIRLLKPKYIGRKLIWTIRKDEALDEVSQLTI